MNNCGTKYKLIELLNAIENTYFCECQKDKLKDLFIDIFNDENLFVVFMNKIDEAKKLLKKDLSFFMDSDPAVNSEDEIITCYPGFKAIFIYRIAHIFYELDYKIYARILSEHAHFLTGIDIHPGAKIGSPFFIDHGTGIVIGETAIIGNYVKLYQGVTIGALSLSKGSSLKGSKRHPTIKDNVTIYANSSILGGDVTIGNNVVIGGNVFLTHSVNDNYKVIIQNPELILIKK